MLNYRNTNIVFGAITLILLVIHLRVTHLSWVIPALFLFDYSLILFYGSYFIDSGFFMPVICKGNSIEKVVSITFDDGPVKEITPELLDLLKTYDVKACFFCIGKNISGNENILKRMAEDGHLIANHSYAHDFWFDLNAASTFTEDLSDTADLIYGATGKKPLYFRPPYGVTTPNLHKAVKKLNYTTIGWNIRTYDTVSSDPGYVLKRIDNGLSPGSILLFHDRMRETVQLLRASIDHLINQGYKIVPLDELIQSKPYA